jgi:hypothetical protein
MDAIAATDRFLMLEHLAHGVRRAHEVQVLVARQRERIKILKRAGLNTLTAELVLAQLEQSQTLYVAENERLEAALEKLDASPTRLRRECRVLSDDSDY